MQRVSESYIELLRSFIFCYSFEFSALDLSCAFMLLVYTWQNKKSMDCLKLNIY